MKRNLSDYFVALFVIICSVVLLGALAFALSGRQLKKSTRTLQINYEDVTGIKVNSELRYAGAPAGRVIGMRHLTAQEREATANKKDAVLVTVSLNDDIPPLPTDVSATLSSDTMLSPKFVALSAGTPGGQTLANNATIEGHPAYGLDQITAAAGPLFEDANKLLTNFNGTITDLKKNLDDFMPKLGPLADSLKTDADNMQNVLTNVDGVAKGADSVLGTADKFITATDKQLQEQLKQLQVTLMNLKVVTTYAKELVENLADSWNPEQYTDQYRENLMKIIKAKLKGKAPHLVEHVEPQNAEVVDLMERLRKSLAGAGGGGGKTKRTTRARKAAGHGRKRARAA